jgi:7-cyano-7-deazaguanine reductase
MNKIPLGRDTEYPQEYAPGVLYAVPRSESRERLGIGGELPFAGRDLWNAWELTWLDGHGKPVTGTATFTFDAASPSIVESKSLKLYLGSFAMSRFDDHAMLAGTIAGDLGEVSGADVDVEIHTGADAGDSGISEMPGTCVDDLALKKLPETVDADLLLAPGEHVTDTLHSHLLRSLCPVTSQPDIGSVMMHYRGPRIVPESFLAYVVSFRQHQDFHEACVERMFLDIKRRCRPDVLTVYARYNRRGGIDINPFRSDFEDEPANFRLWRQ